MIAPTFEHGVSLRQLFPHSRIFGGQDIRVQSCCSDPRECQPGDLFAALECAEFDGHHHSKEAIENGAKAVLSERLLPMDAPQCLVKDTRLAFGQLCQALAGNPCQRMRTIGVTGTHGKTCVSMLLNAIFKAAKMRPGSLTSLAYDDAFDRSEALPNSTPPPPLLADWLARMSANGCGAAILEASSQALAERDLAGVELDGAILTNLRRDHLNLHNSATAYRKVKARLLEHLKPGGFAVVNADDPGSQTLLPKIEQPTITIGMKNPAELTATIVQRFPGEQIFLLHAGHETAAVRTRMLGDQHIYNCLSAAAAALVMGVDLPTIARGLSAVESLPGRMESLACGQPFGVYVDSARTPDALAMILKDIRNTVSGKIYCVYGADGDSDPSIRPLLGRAAERFSQQTVITNDSPRWEEPLHVVHDLLDGYRRPEAARIMVNRREAIHWALSEAGPNDAVLITGRGDQTQQVIDGREIAFDDREVAKQWLWEVGAKIEYEPLARPSSLRKLSLKLVN